MPYQYKNESESDSESESDQKNFSAFSESNSDDSTLSAEHTTEESDKILPHPTPQTDIALTEPPTPNWAELADLLFEFDGAFVKTQQIFSLRLPQLDVKTHVNDFLHSDPSKGHQCAKETLSTHP